MIFVTDICKLTEDFINDYPKAKYPELMNKLGRPYSCLLVDTKKNYFICIPFRSHISHKNSFMFHGTKRSRENKSGLDYTKIVLISKDNYISDKKVVVDDDEYNEVKKNVVQIVTEVLNYVDDYINHVTRITVMHPKQFARKYKYSTLPYFHDVMNI